MFTRERTPVAMHEPCCLAHELPVAFEPWFGVEVEVDTAMGHAVAEMAVERGCIAVLGTKFLEIAQICAELVGRDGAVLPPGPVLGLPANEGGGAERGLARFPDALLLKRIGNDARPCARVRLVDDAPDVRFGF